MSLDQHQTEPHASDNATAIADEGNRSPYDQSHLLDALRSTLKLKNDAALARALGLSPPVISKIRHQQIPVGASVLIRMHEVTRLSISHLRGLMGDRRDQFRIGVQPGLAVATAVRQN